MDSTKNNTPLLPSASDIAMLLRLYLSFAYEGNTPEILGQKAIPPQVDADVEAWLMSEVTERTPPSVPIEDVRSFALRLGNAVYPHMKLRFSRPPSDDVLIASVDSHDAMLQAPEGSPDSSALEELKSYNAELGQRINCEWAQAGLLTEHEYMRRKIQQAKDSQG
jgi:hypothetical protein